MSTTVRFNYCPRCGDPYCNDKGFGTRNGIIIGINYCCECETTIDGGYGLCKECKVK